MKNKIYFILLGWVTFIGGLLIGMYGITFKGLEPWWMDALGLVIFFHGGIICFIGLVVIVFNAVTLKEKP